MHPTILKTEQATIKAGATFARTLRGGDIVLLHGELGAGKTTFVKGVAKGLGIKEAITSPTFTLMGVYNLSSRPLSRDPVICAGSPLSRERRLDPGYPASRDSGMTKKKKQESGIQDDKVGAPRQLCHIDTYRLKNVDELRAIGTEEYIGEPHTITVIEWPEKIIALLRGKKTKNIFFTHIDGGRSIKVP